MGKDCGIMDEYGPGRTRVTAGVADARVKLGCERQPRTRCRWLDIVRVSSIDDLVMTEKCFPDLIVVSALSLGRSASRTTLPDALARGSRRYAPWVVR
jgi:hypothetical protein